MERITATEPVGPARYGHEFRYRLAAGFIGPDDFVIDVACGTGYGHKILDRLNAGSLYLGIDQIDLAGTELDGSWYAQADLEKPWGDLSEAELEFDCFLGFETIEHLANYDHYVRLAQEANKWILVSTPVVPTVGANPYHVHDFKPGDLREIFENENWEHYQTVQQPSELSEITILRRRT